MGQNCAGPERFFVMESVYDEFCKKAESIISRLYQGPPLAKKTSRFTDCGATTMGHRQMIAYQKLVDDAVSKGAKVRYVTRIAQISLALTITCKSTLEYMQTTLSNTGTMWWCTSE